MSYLYLLLNLGSISIPFVFSFHPKLKFYKYWKALAIAIPITMLIYIPWDIIFTNLGFWGFNELYFLNIKLLHLPIEEWLFFICIPYACIFTHYALLYYVPNLQVSHKITLCISYILIGISALLILGFYNRWYTVINYGYAIIILLIALQFNIKLLQRYYLSFLIILIPFFIVNGILTGSGINEQIVWYNHDQNLNTRLLTIPVEDVMYAFTLILTNLLIVEYLTKKARL